MNWVRQGCAIGLCVVLAGGPGMGWALSPVNLNQGYPTQLDDAYPVPKGSLVIQNGVRAEVVEVKSGTEKGRLLSQHNVRVGIGEHSEFTVGATAPHGFLTPGTVEDPQSVYAGFMTQIFRANQNPSVLPTVGVRVTTGIPYAGERKSPSLQAALLASWNAGNDWWISTNAWYSVVPEFQVGQWVPGRTSLWGVTAGAVKAVSPSTAVVFDVNIHEDPLKVETNWVVNPELGFIWAPHKDLHLSFGVGRDYLGAMGEARIRSTIGLTYVF